MHLQIIGAFKVVAKASCIALLCSTSWKWVMIIIYRVFNLINLYDSWFIISHRNSFSAEISVTPDFHSAYAEV